MSLANKEQLRKYLALESLPKPIVLLGDFADPFGNKGKVHLPIVGNPKATLVLRTTYISPVDHVIFAFLVSASQKNLAHTLSNLMWTPLARMKRPIIKIGSADGHALVRVSLVVEDISFPW